MGHRGAKPAAVAWGTYVDFGLPWLMKGTSDLCLMGCVHGCLWACEGVAQRQGPMLFMTSCTSIKIARLAVLRPDPPQGESAATTHAEAGGLQAAQHAQHAQRTCVHTLLEQIQQQNVSIFSCIQAGKNCRQVALPNQMDHPSLGINHIALGTYRLGMINAARSLGNATLWCV